MFRKTFLLFLLLTTALTLLRGQNTTRWLYKFEEPLVSLEGQYLLSSPTIDNPFIQSYFKGEHIGSLMKKETYGNLQPINILGAQNNFKLSLVLPSTARKHTVAHFFSIENKNIAALQCGGDVFRLVFSGNSDFSGDTISIKNNGLVFHGFSQIKGGLVQQYGNSRFTHTFTAALALNTGTRYTSIKLPEASFYTAPDATVIDIYTQLDYNNTKNNSPAFIKLVNGLGAGIDIAYNFKCDKGNNFTVALTDAGFIRWFKPYSTVAETDTTINFRGIEITDILDIDASTSGLNKDSLSAQLNGYTSNASYISYLPTALHLYFFHEFSSRLEFGAGMKHYLNLWHKPMYFIDTKWYALPSFLIAPTLSYGGYAGFNAGLDLGFSIKSWNLYAGTDYLTPFLDNKMFRGKGYYFKIVKRLSYGKKSFESSDKVKISKTNRRPKYNANIFSNSLINKTSKFSENDTIVKP